MGWRGGTSACRRLAALGGELPFGATQVARTGMSKASVRALRGAALVCGERGAFTGPAGQSIAARLAGGPRGGGKRLGAAAATTRGAIGAATAALAANSGRTNAAGSIAAPPPKGQSAQHDNRCRAGADPGSPSGAPPVDGAWP